MSKSAYTRGVVLIQCPGCKNRHLIADNLGWFSSDPQNVESIVEDQGGQVRSTSVGVSGPMSQSIRDQIMAAFNQDGDRCIQWLPEDVSAWHQRINKSTAKPDNKS
jgi:hypothetical protein